MPTEKKGTSISQWCTLLVVAAKFLITVMNLAHFDITTGVTHSRGRRDLDALRVAAALENHISMWWAAGGRGAYPVATAELSCKIASMVGLLHDVAQLLARSESDQHADCIP